jgi:hypothetical protein
MRGQKHGETTVVNIRFDQYDVYIGRAGKGEPGYFGNPFKIGSREDNIKQFKKYFYDRLRNDLEFRKNVHNLKGKRLGCFCKPKNACHGDVIAEYLNTLPEVQPIRLAVVGSRTFDDYGYMKEVLEWFDIKEIISGGAGGADKLAERYAAEKGIPIRIFKAEWDKYGRAAGYKRNVQIVEAADEVVAFWDGKSKGTKHDIDLAEKMGKPCHVFRPRLPEDEISRLG